MLVRSIAFAAWLLLWFAPATAFAAPCELKSFEGSSFTVCAFDSVRATLRLADSDRLDVPLRSFSRLSEGLGDDRARVRFAMNAGMFGSDGRPIGLYVEDGRLKHRLNTRSASGNFYLKPNGVFSLDPDGTLHVETTEAYAARDAKPAFATQSGPMLLIDGKLHPQIAEEGPSQNIRNGVGTVDAAHAAFVISNEPVSFGRLARFFRDALSCRNALYFDGTISSAWIPSLNRLDHQALLGPMVVVLRGR